MRYNQPDMIYECAWTWSIYLMLMAAKDQGQSDRPLGFWDETRLKIRVSKVVHICANRNKKNTYIYIYIYTYIYIYVYIYIYIWLVVWNMAFIFPYIGNFIIPTDFHIFRRGWNHQPDIILHVQYHTFPKRWKHGSEGIVSCRKKKSTSSSEQLSPQSNIWCLI